METIAVGESRQIGITFAPDTNVAEGMYTFHLHLESSNYQTTDIDLNVSVTQSGVGNILFKVQDIYTGTLDADDQLIQGVADARVKLQNEEVLTEEYTLNTDSVGEAYFTDLPAGHYKCRITANNHREYIGRIWIKPGVSANEEVFLDYNLVTVEWEVNEITIEDKYEIVLNATYETDVPAAVVIAEPSSITLPAMKAGDVYNGEFTLTNYGLIRADNVTYTMPEDDQYFHYELLQGLPSGINAKDRITVAFRVTCIQSPDQSEGDGTGGGCERSAKCSKINFDYTCPAGNVFHGLAICCFLHDNGQCNTATQGGGTGNAGGGTLNVRGGGGGGSNVSVAQAPSQVAGVKCFPLCELKEWFFKKKKALKETWQNIIHKVGCSVNTATREFNDDRTDLSVKVSGGSIEIKRWFYRDKWRWEHIRNNLSFKQNSLGNGIESIDKGGVTYKSSPTQDDIYISGTYKIIRKSDGTYRWQDKSGNWKTFDETGRMTAYGTKNGVVGKLLYDSGADGKLAGVTDRNDTQVIWYEYDGDGNISAVHDSDNRRVEYAYTDGVLTSITDLGGNTTTYEYNENGQITRKVDAGGRPTIVTYDGYGNVSSVVDQNGSGHFFEFDYNSAKKEFYARITTSSGMIKEIWYDRNGETKRVDVNGRTIQKIAKDGRNLIITDEKGNVTRKEFDEWDNLTKIIYPDGSIVTFEYEHTFNKPTRIVDQLGNVTEYEYDDHGNLTKKTEAVGTDAERITSYTYDNDGQLLTATIEADANTEAATTAFTYDDSGNISSITDPVNNTTSFTEYDASGNPHKIQDPRGNEWNFTYDTSGRLISQTDPLGNTTAYEYDGANNRTAVVNALLKRFEFEYDDHNNMIKATDPYEKFITTDYNTDNLPTKITDQEGKISTVEYDNEGRITKTIDAAGNEIVYHYDETNATPASSYQPVQIDYPAYTRKFTYDTMGRIVQQTDVLDANTSNTRTHTYDAGGNLISTTDEQGNTTSYEYDALNRLIKTTDPMGGIILRTYDNRNNLISIQDPNNGITYYEYDKNNRLIKTIRPMLQETTYEYDAVGNRTAVNDSKGQKIAYEYNEVNKLVKVRYFNPADHVNPVKEVTFTYDKLGNILTCDDGSTTSTYAYDDLSRKINETVNYGPFIKSFSYTYYNNGAKKTFTGPDGIVYNYTYDDNNRLTAINIPGQGQITNIYDQTHWNRPAKRMLPGGSSTDYTYDPLMRFKTITAKDPGQNPMVNQSYQYSPAGNIIAKNTEHGNYTYQYDKLNRLTNAVNPTVDDETYTYDPLGNRLTSAGTTGSWNYNANNELTGYAANTFTHDANGNMIQKTTNGVTTKYIYDTEDRLTKVRDGADALIASYYYDPFGRRLWKEVDGTKIYFLYSDEGLIGEYDASGNEIKTYGWAPDSTWGTNPLFVKIAGTYYWYQNDHLGTPQKITRTNGSVAWAATYDSFGNCQINTEAITNNLRFPGQYFDTETGIYYNLNRYYDPTIGRYLRTDPLGQRLNLYSYVFNNPNRMLDPLGLCDGMGTSMILCFLLKIVCNTCELCHEKR